MSWGKPITVYTAYKAAIGTLKRSRYNPDRSVSSPGGGGGHCATAVGVGGAVMVLFLKSLMRGIRGWFYFFCTTLGSPVRISQVEEERCAQISGAALALSKW